MREDKGEWNENKTAFKLPYLARRIGLLPVHLIEKLLEPLLEFLVFRALVELADEVPAVLQCVAREAEGGATKILEANAGVSKVMFIEGPTKLTMLPAWSRNEMPLVFIILRYALFIPLLRKSVGRSQGADMSLRTICMNSSLAMRKGRDD